MTYERLENQYNELIKRGKRGEDISSYEQDREFSILVALDMISNYEYIKMFCDENLISKVCDIGCAWGYQSEVFRNSGIVYRGIDNNVNKDFWNDDIYFYENKTFPCALNPSHDELAISVLCLGWNCFMTEGDKTAHKQFESLASQFEQALIYMQAKFVDVAKTYYSNVINLKDNFYLMY